MNAYSPENQKKWAKVIAKAWSDPAFKAKLLKNPEAVLAEQGVNFPQLPKGVRMEMHENTNTTIHLVLPAKPSEMCSEEELLKVAAGMQICNDPCGPNWGCG